MSIRFFFFFSSFFLFWFSPRRQRGNLSEFDSCQKHLSKICRKGVGGFTMSFTLHESQLLYNERAANEHRRRHGQNEPNVLVLKHLANTLRIEKNQKGKTEGKKEKEERRKKGWKEEGKEKVGEENHKTTQHNPPLEEPRSCSLLAYGLPASLISWAKNHSIFFEDFNNNKRWTKQKKHSTERKLCAELTLIRRPLLWHMLAVFTVHCFLPLL